MFLHDYDDNNWYFLYSNLQPMHPEKLNVLAKFSLHPPPKIRRFRPLKRVHHFVTEISSKPIINFQGQDVSFDGGGGVFSFSHESMIFSKEKTGKPWKSSV